MPAAGGNIGVNVFTAQGCKWPFQGNDPWLSVVPDSGGAPNGDGNGTVILQVASNGGPRRVGAATIAYQTIMVDQAGTSGSTCTLQVVPTSATFPAAGGAGRFTVIPSAEDCGWSVDQSAGTEDWVSGFVTLHAVGTRTLNFSVKPCSAPNRPACPSTGALQIRDSANQTGATFTINQ